MMTLKMAPFVAAFHLQRRVGAFLPSCLDAEEDDDEDGAVVLNSLVVAAEKGAQLSVSLGKGAVVEHCLLSGGGRVEVGDGALVSGLAFAGRGDLRGMCSCCSETIVFIMA